jgi:hypothetical protein
MSLVIGLVVAFLIGYVTRRWLVVVLGPVAGFVVVGISAIQNLGVWDNPAILVAVATSCALAAGVLLGRRSHRNRTGATSIR